MSEIKIINKSIIGHNTNFNKLTEEFNTSYYYEYRYLNSNPIFIPVLPITANLYAHYDSETFLNENKKNNTLVTQWTDSSGNNRHLIQPTAANQPNYLKYHTPKPCVAFIDGKFLYSETNFTELAGTNPKTIFCVFATTGKVATDSCVCGISGSTNPQFGWFCIFTGHYSGTPRDYRFVTYGNDNDNAFRNYSYNPRVAVAAFGNTDLPSKTRVYMNKIKYTDNTTINPNTNSTKFLAGRAINSNTVLTETTHNYNGLIFEMIIYSASLTNEEILSVSNYLMKKYSIPEET